MPRLIKSITHSQPNIILSMGEGHVGEFTIETLGRNERKQRKDNAGNLPHSLITPDGPDNHSASVNASALQESISKLNIPIRISTDAGAFLCEETLYCLESLKLQYGFLELVAFVHLPPYGSTLEYQGQERICDKALLESFGKILLKHVITLHSDSTFDSEE